MEWEQTCWTFRPSSVPSEADPPSAAVASVRPYVQVKTKKLNRGGLEEEEAYFAIFTP